MSQICRFNVALIFDIINVGYPFKTELLNDPDFIGISP